MPINGTARTSQHGLPPPQGVEKARADRARGGQHSARAQQRDSFGQFAGGPRRSKLTSGSAAVVSAVPEFATDARRGQS